MKNKKLLFLIFILFTSFVFAKKETKKVVTVDDNWSVGIFGSYLKSVDFEDGVSFGLVASKTLSPNFDLELRVSHGTIKTESSEKVDKGKFKLTPVQIGITYNFLFDKFKPYISLGVGYYFFTFKNDDLGYYEQYGYTLTNSIDNKFGFHGSLGLNYLISDKFILNVDLRYVYTDFSGTYEIQDNYSKVTIKENYDGDLSHIAFSLGCKMIL